jgi:Putative peptidoglycan binding domain
MSTTVAYDAISANIGALPAGQHCGYVTGSSIIIWTADQFIADPSAVRIDQSPDNTALDETADVLDVETGAATIGDIVSWVNAARANYAKGARPGQREPMVYCNGSTLTAVANALTAAKLTDVPIWLADPNTPQVEAEDKINSSSGPYPIHGVQFSWLTDYDVDVFLSSWLTAVSGKSGDTVQAGSYGPAVAAAQTGLNTWAATVGRAKLTVDSCFGLETLAAVDAFQTAKKLTVDGVVGAATWAELTSDPPKPAPVPEAYAAPKGFKAGNVDLAVSWDAVPDLGGTAPTGYTVAVYEADGATLIGTKVVDALSTTVVLALGKSYQVHVWANGGKDAPAHASINVTT